MRRTFITSDTVKRIASGICICLLFSDGIVGQAADTVNLNTDRYVLSLYSRSYYRYQDPSTLVITCGFVNLIDSTFYTCSQNTLFKVKDIRIQELQDGAGCCKYSDDILFTLHKKKYDFNAVLKRFRYYRGILILRKKDFGKIQLPVYNLMEKERLDSLKTGVEYHFNLTPPS